MLTNKSSCTLKAVIVSSFFFQRHLAQDTAVVILRMYMAIFLSTLRIFGSWYLIIKLPLGKRLLLVQLSSPCVCFPLWLLGRFFFVSSDLRVDSDSHSCGHRHSYPGWNCFPLPHHWTHLSYKLQELFDCHTLHPIFFSLWRLLDVYYTFFFCFPYHLNSLSDFLLFTRVSRWHSYIFL